MLQLMLQLTITQYQQEDAKESRGDEYARLSGTFPAIKHCKDDDEDTRLKVHA